MKKITLLVLFSIVGLLAHAQIAWQKWPGGDSYDYGFDIRQTNDGGYIIAGITMSTNGDVAGYHGGTRFDGWAIKMSFDGALEWQRCIGGSNNDWVTSVALTADGGYIFCGYTESNDGDVAGNHGGWDAWVVKLSATGTLEWQKCLGGSGNDIANCIIQSSDGGYVIAGNTSSGDGDITNNHGKKDCWIVKLSSSGNVVWQQTYGGSEDDEANCVLQETDGSYIVAGGTLSDDSDVSDNKGGEDGWGISLSTTGSLQWQKCIGGTGLESISSIIKTDDGGYITAGHSNSEDGDVAKNYGADDFWIVKLSSAGIPIWNMEIGGSDYDRAYSVTQTANGGFLVAGDYKSRPKDIYMQSYYDDILLVGLSAAGSIQWQQILGGHGQDGLEGCTVRNTTDGGYILISGTNSLDGDLLNRPNRLDDAWVVKLSRYTAVDNVNIAPTVSIIPNPATGLVRVSGVKTGILKICDITGRLVKEEPISESVSVAALTPGLYLVKITCAPVPMRRFAGTPPAHSRLHRGSIPARSSSWSRT